MRRFDPTRPNLIPYAEAESLILDGDIAQFRGASWLSTAIQYATGGPHSHSALLQRNNGTVDVLEVREWFGGRRVPLRSQAERHPGRIDVFRPNRHLWPQLSSAEVLGVMRTMTGRNYGYRGVLRLALQRVPGLWRLWPIAANDELSGNDAPFCSHAVCTSFRLGGIDPVPRKPDHMVTPNDLTHSLLFDYQFTIAAPHKIEQAPESVTGRIGGLSLC